MSRKILCSLVLIVTTALIAGADSIMETKVTPNPGGMGSIVQGTGTYTVDPANTFSGLKFYADNTKSKQSTQIAATVNNIAFTWTGTLSVTPGNYDCYGVLTTINGMTMNVNKSNVINADVK